MIDTPIPIKFYTDTHIARAVAVQLRSRGVDIVRCEEVGLAEAEDIVHLEYATREGRVVVTQDNDFLTLAAQWHEEGRKHAGIVFANPDLKGQGQISVLVRELLEIHQLIEIVAGTVTEDFENQTTYVG